MKRSAFEKLQVAEKDKVAELDNLYVQIKLHHDRKEYEKAALLFKKVSQVQNELKALHTVLERAKNQTRFTQTIERLSADGILTKVVKRPNEKSFALD